MSKKVVIIGSGMGGLSAAIRLQLKGFHVEIYEKNAIPGGKMSQKSFAGYTFDVGPTIVMMPELYKAPFLLAGKKPDDYFQLDRLEPMYDAYFKGETYRHYTISSDLVKLMSMNECLDEESALGFLKYLADMYQRYQVAVRSFITRPFRYKRDFYNLKMIGEALKLKTFNSAEDMMASYIPNKDLQQMMSFQTLYIGISPKKGPSLYNIIPMIELLYGVWFVKGGMHQYAKALERLFVELGGQIHYNKTVNNIVIADHRVKGIQLDEEFIGADIVISNADFPYTMTKLIEDDQNKGKYTNSKIESMDYSCSCLVFYWGVKGTFEDLKNHNFVICEDLSTNLDQIFDGRLVEDPSLYLHIPSHSDKSLAPDGHSTFYVLIPVSELGISNYQWTEDIIGYYRQSAINTLKKLPGLENLSQLIEAEEIFTPNDFKQAFYAYRGATFGLQPTLIQSNHMRPQSKSLEVEGLYYTGSSTHPGAGVPIALEGGKICSDEVLRDFGESNDD